MSYEFKNRMSLDDLNTYGLMSLEGNLSPEDTVRLNKIKKAWDFYDGYHWEDIPPQDKPEITQNYCRAFVNKFVATEFGEGFTIKYPDDIEGDIDVNDEGQDITEYLESVWEYNNKFKFCTELGQSKSITGDGWVHVRYYKAGTFYDPFLEFPKGKISIIVVPTAIVFPKYNPHNKDLLEQVTLAYPIEKEEEGFITRRPKKKKVIYKQIWTRDTIEEWEGNHKINVIRNKYKFIPFRQIKNLPVVGRENGLSDLEDIIPLNTELNLKLSDMSEILDYHSAPITIVFGAKVSNLQKGANKVWGGLPKDSKVQNLELQGDLNASSKYIQDLKVTMCEVGGIPEGSLGGNLSISNTSGVALSYANLPLIEKVRVKRSMSSEGIQDINKMILSISLQEGIIKKPEGISNREFYSHEIIFPDTLPKDQLVELQMIETEFRLGIENREGAMKRLGRKEINAKLEEIDKEREDKPEIYGLQKEDDNIDEETGEPKIEVSSLNLNKEGNIKRLNSGFTNGPETNKED